MGRKITSLMSQCLLENYRETMKFQREGNRQWDVSFLCRNSNKSSQNWDTDLKTIRVFDLLKNAG